MSQLGVIGVTATIAVRIDQPSAPVK